MSTLSNKEFRKQINLFYNLKQEKKKIDDEFEKNKLIFYSYMNRYWKENKVEEKTIQDEGFNITKVESVKIDFDVDKVKMNIPKELIQELINKKVEIIDYQGLIEYLKTCGVDPKKFKRFISIKESVDVKALEKLEQLGEISLKQLKGCYEVTTKEPYYKINTLEKVSDSNEDEGE